MRHYSSDKPIINFSNNPIKHRVKNLIFQSVRGKNIRELLKKVFTPIKSLTIRDYDRTNYCKDEEKSNMYYSDKLIRNLKLFKPFKNLTLCPS